jgi:outer membrane protein TolC
MRTLITTCAVIASIILLCAENLAKAQEAYSLVIPEQSSISVRDPLSIRSAQLPAEAFLRPKTIRDDDTDRAEAPLPLDEAIRISLQNTDVVRVLTGVSASSSGSTVYDAAITQTQIEQAASIFDPTLNSTTTFFNNENPAARFDPLDPTSAIFVGSRNRNLNSGFSLSKLNYGGSTTSLNYSNVSTTFKPGVFPLNPQSSSFVDLSFSQPLLRGRGSQVNLVPVVVARINTERSFFTYKNSVQNMVRGVIEAYWGLVSARTSVWVLEQQVAQLKENYERALARKKREFATAAEVAQTQTAYANFKASLVGARANLLLRETALRNLLGLPPTTIEQYIPNTPMQLEPIEFDWEQLVMVGEQQRPDIIQLKLILEADQQLVVQANNTALPQLNGVANYRWNGLEGETLANNIVSTGAGEYTNWSAGVNFSVPLGLRQSRAALRRQELLCQQDQINIDQAVHQMVHTLAISVRNLDQFFAQYEAFKEARKAARINVQQQIAEYASDRAIFLNVLQAVTDWGNAVQAETQSLVQYNIELANLEFQTGTILEAHGIRFVEERYGTIGPLRLLGSTRCYPMAIRPDVNNDRYSPGTRPSEQTIEFESIDFGRRREGNTDAPDAPEAPDASGNTDDPDVSRPIDDGSPSTDLPNGDGSDANSSIEGSDSAPIDLPPVVKESAIPQPNQ